MNFRRIRAIIHKDFIEALGTNDSNRNLSPQLPHCLWPLSIVLKTPVFQTGITERRAIQWESS